MNKKDYLELVKKRKAAQKPVELEMPSGAVWLVLPPNVQQYAVTGKLPLHLLAGKKSLKKAAQNADVMAENISGDDIINIYAMARDALFNNVIEPKITLEETADSITPDMIDNEDFDFFTSWVISGGQVTQNSFRETIEEPVGTGKSGLDSENEKMPAV